MQPFAGFSCYSDVACVSESWLMPACRMIDEQLVTCCAACQALAAEQNQALLLEMHMGTWYLLLGTRSQRTQLLLLTAYSHTSFWECASFYVHLQEHTVCLQLHFWHSVSSSRDDRCPRRLNSAMR